MLIRFLIVSVLLLACSRGVCSEGLCSAAGPPADGSSSCSSGSNPEKKTGAEKYEFVDSEPESHELKVILEKREYAKLPFTNDVDFKIRRKLDRADELIVDSPEESMEMFDQILQEEPRSIRAQYAKIRAMQFINVTAMSDEQKKAHNHLVIDQFLSLIKNNKSELLPPVYQSAVHQALLASSEEGFEEKKIEILNLAFANANGKDQFYPSLLVQDLFLLERYHEALEVVDKVAQEFPHNIMFKFFKGILLKKVDRKKEGNALLRSIEASPNDAVHFGQDILNLGYQLRKKGREQDVDILFKECSKAHLFPSRYQTPLEAIPNIEGKPLWDPEVDVGLSAHEEEFELLKEKFEAIKKEGLSLLKDDSLWHLDSTGYLDHGNWTEFPLYSWGKRRYQHCALATETCAFLKQFRASTTCPKCTSKFIRLAPKTHVWSHSAPTNARLRIHIPIASNDKARLRVGKDNVLTWKVGEKVIFDDSFEHEYWNEDEKESVMILSIDVTHPEVGFAKDTFNQHTRNVYMAF